MHSVDGVADEVIHRSSTQRVLFIVFIVLLSIVPLSASRFYMGLLATIYLSILGSLGLCLLTGVAGQVSIGNAAFMAVASFTVASGSVQFGLPLFVTIPIGACVSAASGVLVGVAAVRMRGLYLVIATLAFHYVVIYAAKRYQLAASGAAGFVLPEASVGGIVLRDTLWYLLLLLVAVLAIKVVTNLIQSRFGRAWSAIRQREAIAEVVGVHVGGYKLLVFGTSAFLIGIQGGLLAYYVGFVSVDGFTLDVAIQYLAMVIVGGQGSVLGAVLGAVFVTLLPYVVRNLVDHVPASLPGVYQLTAHTFQIQAALYGLGIIVVLLFEPSGLAGLYRRGWGYVRTWPISEIGVATGEYS
jgi:branched-chain amino acid transport system permease protein